MDAVFWQTIRDNDYAVPEDCEPADLTPELVGYLGSTNPVLRDSYAYAIMGYWIERGVYDDDELRGLAMQLVSNLAVGLGEQGSDTIFLRAFSALVLSEIVSRDNAEPFFTRHEVHNLLRWALEYYVQERDLRAFIPDKGWAHATAYSSDLLRELARNRYLTPVDLESILTGVAERITAPAESVYVNNEDERMVLVIWTILQRGMLTIDVVTRWLARCVHVMALASPDGQFEPDTHAAYQNTRNFLRSLYFRLIFAKKAPPLGRELRPKLLAAIKAVNG
jgi:hypothetical protein